MKDYEKLWLSVGIGFCLGNKDYRLYNSKYINQKLSPENHCEEIWNFSIGMEFFDYFFLIINVHSKDSKQYYQNNTCIVRRESIKYNPDTTGCYDSSS